MKKLIGGAVIAAVYFGLEVTAYQRQIHKWVPLPHHHRHAAMVHDMRIAALIMVVAAIIAAWLTISWFVRGSSRGHQGQQPASRFGGYAARQPAQRSGWRR